jgi:hypothetical protein
LACRSNQFAGDPRTAVPTVAGIELREVFEYDIPTEAGETGVFKSGKH